MRPVPSALVGMLLAATLSAPAALAQTSTASPGQMHHPAMNRTDGDATNRVERRIADLRAKLHITPDEQALWDKFAGVMRDNAKQMRERASERAAKLSSMNASDNMQSYAQLAMLHAQDLQNLSAAFQSLYASLSPDQQHTADTMFRDATMHRRAMHRR